MASKREAWLSPLPSDRRPALLASDEPFARFAVMTAVLGKSEDDAEVRGARKAVVADPHVRALVDRLPDWESGFTFGGQNSPAFPPNLLRLLHGMGVRAGDFPAIERMLDQMLRHQADDGRYLTPGGTTGKNATVGPKARSTTSASRTPFSSATDCCAPAATWTLPTRSGAGRTRRPR